MKKVFFCLFCANEGENVLIKPECNLCFKLDFYMVYVIKIFINIYV